MPAGARRWRRREKGSRARQRNSSLLVCARQLQALVRRRTRSADCTGRALWLAEDGTDKEVARPRLPTTHAHERGNLGPMANLVRHGLLNQRLRRHLTTVLSDLYRVR